MKDNLETVQWTLTSEQIEKLDRASEVRKIYPYWHQTDYSERNPLPIKDYIDYEQADVEKKPERSSR